MVEPLDADTLAEGERLVKKARTEGGRASLASLEWLVTHAPALLAVARDHARLTAHYESDLRAARAGDEARSDD